MQQYMNIYKLKKPKCTFSSITLQELCWIKHGVKNVLNIWMKKGCYHKLQVIFNIKLSVSVSADSLVLTCVGRFSFLRSNGTCRKQLKTSKYENLFLQLLNILQVMKMCISSNSLEALFKYSKQFNCSLRGKNIIFCLSRSTAWQTS